MKKYFLLLASCFLFLASCFSQQNIFTAGFQYKPFVSSVFFQTASKLVSQNNIDFQIKETSGYCAGMVLRRGFTKMFSIETAINYVKRNYEMTIADHTPFFTGKSSYSVGSYEIPLMGFIFLRVGDKLFMDTGLGVSLDMYASDISYADTYFNYYSQKNGVFQMASLANVGFEYRTEKSGYFFLGASYHLPFQNIYTSQVYYHQFGKYETVYLNLPGNYLSVDFRYFFHEEPMKEKKKKK